MGNLAEGQGGSGGGQAVAVGQGYGEACGPRRGRGQDGERRPSPFCLFTLQALLAPLVVDE